MEASAEPKVPSGTIGMSKMSSFSLSDRFARFNHHACSCSTRVSNIFPMAWMAQHWTTACLVCCEQGEHIERSSVQCCRFVDPLSQRRLEAVHFRREGRAARGQRKLLGVQVVSHIWLHWRHPEEIQAFHHLAVEGRSTGVSAVVKVVLPGAGGAASPLFWPAGMFSPHCDTWWSRLQWRARERPVRQPCVCTHQHNQGGQARGWSAVLVGR